MKHAFFVTGTDTGVGKTLIAAALVHLGAQLGYAAAGLKPVAAGCREQGGRLLSEDVELLQAASSVQLAPAIINPYAFAPPLAPHIAAQQASCRIELSSIVAAVKQAQAEADFLVVEGVGGFRVPLGPDLDTADLAQMLGLPLVLVVGLRLGCLNHALLTAEAIAARGLRLAGWVANGIDPLMAAPQENLHALREYLLAPCLGVVPYQAQPDFRVAATALDGGMLLR
jgi:dethiobiotin synthetase